MPEPQQSEEQRSRFTRHENFESWYANNIQFHPSEWDLKLIFGELDWPPDREGSTVVQQHTAMTLSWRQAKFMRYFLDLQIAIHEMAHGKITIPESILPPVPQPPEGSLADDPVTHKIFAYISEAREKLIASNT